MPVGVYEHPPQCGFQKEHRFFRKSTTWNKGLTKETDKRVASMAKKPKNFVKGYVPWNRGKTNIFSEKTLKSMRTRRGKKHWNWKGGITSLNAAIRALPEYKQWRDDTFQRNNYTCQRCDKRGSDLEAHHNIKPFIELLQEFLQEYNQFSPFEDQDTLVRLAMKWQPFWTAEGQTLCKDCHNLTKKGRK